MYPAKGAQIAFIAFTLVQIVMFIAVPWLYSGLSGGIDPPPYYLGFRLIGLKEMGLMTIYTAGVVLEDDMLTWTTIFGRSTTLVFTPLMIFVMGAPSALWGGVVQDVSGAGITAYLLLTDPERSKRKPKEFLPLKHSRYMWCARLALCLAGCMEMYNGLALFYDVNSFSYLLNEQLEEPALGIKSFGYMSFLVGLYQFIISLRSDVDGLMYMAVNLHHLAFYVQVSNLVLPRILQRPCQANVSHLYSSFLVGGTTLLAFLQGVASTSAPLKQE